VRTNLAPALQRATGGAPQFGLLPSARLPARACRTSRFACVHAPLVPLLYKSKRGGGPCGAPLPPLRLRSVDPSGQLPLGGARLRISFGACALYRGAGIGQFQMGTPRLKAPPAKALRYGVRPRSGRIFCPPAPRSRQGRPGSKNSISRAFVSQWYSKNRDSACPGSAGAEPHSDTSPIT
jgi:hypothetical protein